MPSPLERIFIDWDRPALPEAASILTDRYLARGEVRMAGVAVALPGGRAGRRLGELLVEESTRRGVPLIPPRIVTIGALPELLIESPLPAAEPTLATVAVARALSDEPRERVTRVFPALPGIDDLAGWSALGSTVLRLHREVTGGGRSFADVSRSFSSGQHLYDDHERWDILASVVDRYERILQALGRADPDLVRLSRSPRFRDDAPEEIWLIGIAEAPRVTMSLVKRFAGPVHVVIHAPTGEAHAFDELGLVTPDAWIERGIPIDDGVLSIVDRPGDQSAEVVSRLLRLDGRYTPEEITIGVPDPDLLPYLEQRLEEAGALTRDAAGTPVERSAPYRLLEAVAAYLRTRTWESFAALRRHPDLPTSGAPGLGRIDEYHSSHLPARVPESRGPAGDGDVLAGTASVVEGELLLGRFHGRRGLIEWQERILGFLAECYGSRPLDRENPPDRRLLASLEALRSVAVSLHSLPRELNPTCDAASAIRMLLDSARAYAVPDNPDAAAIELLGWLEMHLDDAPVGVIAGLNEPFLPESVNADSFLPDGLRSALGITDNRTRYARDAYQLTALLHSREHVSLVAGRLDASGDPLRPSRLMLATGGEELARRIRLFAAAPPVYGPAEEGADRDVSGSMSPAARAPSASGPDGEDRPRSIGSGAPAVQRSAFPLPPERVILLDPPEAMSVTDFRLLLEDPYRYALERHLRLEPLDDTAREMDGRIFGNLAHHVLEAFGHSPQARSTDAGSVGRVLDEFLDRRAAELFGERAGPAVAIQVEQLRARLRAFGRWQVSQVAEGWEIVLVEGALAGNPRPPGASGTLEGDFIVDGQPMKIRGRLDRIDYNSRTGEWLILDYKTGDVGDAPEKTHRLGPATDRVWKDLQLPLYRHLAATVQRWNGGRLIPEAGLPSVKLGYVLLPRELENTGSSIAGWTTEELAGADECARTLIRFVRRGRYEFDGDLAARYRRGPLAPLLGLRQLVLAEEDEEEDAELAAR